MARALPQPWCRLQWQLAKQRHKENGGRGKKTRGSSYLYKPKISHSSELEAPLDSLKCHFMSMEQFPFNIETYGSREMVALLVTSA